MFTPLGEEPFRTALSLLEPSSLLIRAEGQHLLVCVAGPHPHALPALASLAPVSSGIWLLGLAKRRKRQPQNADPSGKGLLDNGAERSEALAGVGVGPHARAGGVRPDTWVTKQTGYMGNTLLTFPVPRFCL